MYIHYLHFVTIKNQLAKYLDTIYYSAYLDYYKILFAIYYNQQYFILIIE